jgi:hypothetical protein
MPKAYAAKLAKYMAEYATTEPVLVDVPNDGFNEEVAKALEALGHKVDRHPIKTLLTIHPKAYD